MDLILRPMKTRTLRSLTTLPFTRLFATFFSVLSITASALPERFSSLRRCCLLIDLPFPFRFVMPAPLCTDSTDDLRVDDALMDVRDLSRFREGEEALLAAREWMDVAGLR